MLVALVAAVALASVASAGPNTAKQRVAISATVQPSGRAVLDPLRKGTLGRDAGMLGGDWSRTPDRTVVRDGQTVYIHTATWTFTGRRGTLVFRERNEWVDAGSSPETPPWVAFGIWKVVRGTGQYAEIAGGGRSGHAGLGRKWFARYEGLLTAPR
jgi:hypothetical protein